MDAWTRDLLSASPSLRRLVVELAGDDHLAADLVQDAWVVALRRRSRPPRDPAAWARAVVRRLLGGGRRRDQRRREQEGLAAEARTSPAPDEVLEHQSLLQVIARAAEELEEPYRTVINLRYWEELSPPEIAARLGRPHDTVKTQLRRGLEALRERLEREHGGGRKAWLAPLRIALDAIVQSPAPAGLRPGVLLAAAGVSLLAWLGWMFLGEAPRSTVAVAAQPPSLPAQIAEPLSSTAAAGRVVAPAEVLPDAAVPQPGPASSRLAIRVVDDQGRPVPDAEVYVLARGGGIGVRGFTDPSGALELVVERSEIGTTLEPGLEDRVALTAYRAGYAAPPWFLVRCSSGSTRSLLVELPGPELLLEGQVTDEAGTAIAGAEVEVISRNRVRRSAGDLLIEDGLPMSERADASGRFRIRGLQPGMHTLAVRASGWASSEQTVDGRAGGAVECTLRLTEAGSVSGIVRDERGEPLPGALLTYELPVFNRFGAFEARTGPDGSYRIDDLPLGPLLLCAQDPGRSGLLCRATVEIDQDTPASWNPVLERVEGIRVRIVNEDGVALEGWQVTFYQRGVNWTRLIATDADGRAAVFDLPPGQAIQVAVRRGPTDRFPRAGLTGLRPSGDEILLVATSSEPTGSVGGTVLTDQGVPPTDAAAWLFRDGHADSEAIDASSGEFVFEQLPDGTYELMVIWGGHGKLDLGRVELVGGGLLDSGSTVMPETGRVVIDWSWPEEASGAALPFRLLHVPPKGRAAVVLKGPAPPPAQLDLLPGSYALMVDQDQVQPLTFEIRSGLEVRVASGPTPSQR